MNIFLFSLPDTATSLMLFLSYGLFFGFFISIVRFLLFTFLERHEA